MLSTIAAEDSILTVMLVLHIYAQANRNRAEQSKHALCNNLGALVVSLDEP